MDDYLWIILVVALVGAVVIAAMFRKPKKDEEIVLPHRPVQPGQKRTTKPK